MDGRFGYVYEFFKLIILLWGVVEVKYLGNVKLCKVVVEFFIFFDFVYLVSGGCKRFFIV